MSDRSFLRQNSTWTYFGFGTTWPADKCSRCYEFLEKFQRPNRHCINCWKLEIFFSNCTDLGKMKNFLLAEAKDDPTLSGKWLNEPMELSEELRHSLTSIPKEGHPNADIKEDGVILIYTQSIAERNERAGRLQKVFTEQALYHQKVVSYRRGCLNFDAVIGPWKTWWPLDRDYEEKEEIVS